MDALTKTFWSMFLAADGTEIDQRRTLADLPRDMMHDEAANAMAALREMGYLIFHVDEEITGTIVARSGEYLLIKNE